jgi:integrase
MGRKRKNQADAWLPERVYRGRSAYEWRPLGGKCTVLLPLHRSVSGEIEEPPAIKKKVLEAHESAVLAAAAPQDVGYWLTRFMSSDKFQRLSGLTQADYIRYIEVKVDKSNPKSKATRNGIRHVFGSMRPQAVTPMHIRKYMDYWGSDSKETTANRHLTCLQTFFKWLRQYVAGLDVNPAEGIIRFPEKSRKVYITDAQYLQILEAALISTTPWFFAFVEIAYLCGLRLHEVCGLNIDDITSEAGAKFLTVRRGKGSKGELIEISDRLQAAIDSAIAHHPTGRPEPLKNRPLVRNTRGDRVSRSAVQNALENVKSATGITDIRVHDLKKKAGSDGKDLGHKTARMKELYNLSLEKGKATR